MVILGYIFGVFVFLLGLVMFGVGFTALFADDKDDRKMAWVAFLFATYLLVAPIAGLTDRVHKNGYKSGQIDAINGVIKYEKIESTSEDAWQEK